MDGGCLTFVAVTVWFFYVTVNIIRHASKQITFYHVNFNNFNFYKDFFSKCDQLLELWIW